MQVSGILIVFVLVCTGYIQGAPAGSSKS